jgi:hypothetical protein
MWWKVIQQTLRDKSSPFFLWRCPSQLRFASGWKKVLIIFAISDVLIVLADFVATFFYGSHLRTEAGWLFGSNDKETFGSLLFIEGALIVGVGAALAAGFAENRMSPPLGSPSAPYDVEKISETRAEFREKQISTGLRLMLLGAPLIIIPILLI